VRRAAERPLDCQRPGAADGPAAPEPLACGAGSLHRPIAAMKTLIVDNFDSFTFKACRIEEGIIDG